MAQHTTGRYNVRSKRDLRVFLRPWTEVATVGVGVVTGGGAGQQVSLKALMVLM